MVGRERELAQFEGLLATVRDGGSASLLVRGEPGVGKSALLDQLIASATGFRVVRAVGVEGEVDLPYAGLQQLCRLALDSLGALPDPQSEALRVAFGLASGAAPDRYIVGLAVLSLMSEVAATRPLLCVIDDTQWLDRPTMQALAFVARRLGADSVGLVFASREVVEELAGVPELPLGGLATADARVLLDSVLMRRLDVPVRERLLAETNGNPLALLEIPRALTPAEAITGIIRPSGGSLSDRIEDGFRRQVAALPEHTRRLLIVAAAEPLGDPLLLMSAAARLGLAIEAADAAVEAGLFEISERCSFRHPLVRSAVYGAASSRERRAVHGALAAATDAQLDPDRKAWHRAQATVAPDEDVARELELTAERAKSRGGPTAAAAFLERAAMLTPEPQKRAERALAAAEVMFEAGVIDAVDHLLRAVDTTKLDDFHAARVERLHAKISLSVGGSERAATVRLVAAARRIAEHDPSLAHAVRLEAVRMGWTFLTYPEVFDAVAAGLADSRASESGAIAERLLQGWGRILEQRDPLAGSDLIREAAIALQEKAQLEESELPMFFETEIATRALWDFDNWQALTRRTLQVARDRGSLLILLRMLAHWASVKAMEGDFPAARAAEAEAEAIAEATRVGHDWHRSPAEFVALRLDEGDALSWIDALQREYPRVHPALECARAIVYNGTGHYEAAFQAAERSCDAHPFGAYSWTLPELVEAAARSGRHERAREALELLSARARFTSTDWGLGIVARSRALLADDSANAESLCCEAIERLGRARTRPDCARAHLVYGEWLRRENRRVDARQQLRTALEMFTSIGIPGFADRARRELTATGETPRKRTDATRADLTPQETQIARLAAEGLTNPEIGAKLFISARTVEWHLRKIFPKLGITSRRDLRALHQAF